MEVLRCGGSCHTQHHSYQRCSVGRRENTSLEVVYQVVREGDKLEEECHTIKVETHTECSCGCPQLQCSSRQVHPRSRTTPPTQL